MILFFIGIMNPPPLCVRIEMKIWKYFIWISQRKCKVIQKEYNKFHWSYFLVLIEIFEIFLITRLSNIQESLQWIVFIGIVTAYICNIFAIYLQCIQDVESILSLLAFRRLQSLGCLWMLIYCPLLGFSLAIQVFLWLVLLPVSFAICLPPGLPVWVSTAQSSPFLVRISR